MALEMNILNVKSVTVSRPTAFHDQIQGDFYGCMAKFVDEQNKTVEIMFTSKDKQLLKRLEVLNAKA